MTDDEFRELVKANTKGIAELKEYQTETARQMRKTDEQMKKTDEQMKKTDERIDRLGQRFWDFWNNRWEEVEDFFYRYFLKNKKLSDVKFDEVERNIITADWQEHDIILTNWRASALISVKYKLHKKDIDSLLKKEMVRMKYFLHNVGSKHRLYWWIASFVVNKEVEEYAKSKWLYIFTRDGDSTILLNDDNFVAQEF